METGGRSTDPDAGAARHHAARRLRGAVLVAAVGALAVVVAPVFPVAGSSGDGVRGGSVPAALAVAVSLLAVVALAGWSLTRHRPQLTAGALIGAGAVAVGLAGLDLQLFLRALDANRLELLRPTRVVELAPGAGAWLVLLGHVALVVAAALAAVARRGDVQEGDVQEGDAADRDGTGDDGEPVTVAARIGPTRSATAVGAALALAVSLFLAPFSSEDPVLVVPAVVQSGPAPALGAVAIAVAVLVVVALALVSTSPTRAVGALGGAGLAAVSAVAPRLLGALTDASSTPGPGSVLGTVSALALVALAAEIARRPPGGAPGATRPVPPVPRPLATLPSVTTLERAGAGIGALAGVVALVGAWATPLAEGGAQLPAMPQTRVLLVAGVVLILACTGLAATGDPVWRPVVGVVWLGVVLGAGAVLQGVLVVVQVTGVAWGPGAVAAALAVVVAGCGAVAVGVAGAVERDDVDLTELPDAPRRVTVPAVLGAVAAVGGLLLPLYTAPDFTPPGVLGPTPGDWGWDTWALVLVAGGIAVAVTVALRARPIRGAALLGATAVVVAVHLAGWPLTSSRVPGASAGPGAVLSVVAVLALAVGAIVLARSSPARTSS